MELGECLEEGEDLETSETVRLRTAQQPQFSFSSIDSVFFMRVEVAEESEGKI